MSLETARALLQYAARVGGDARALAEAVLIELETPEERRKRYEREKKARQRAGGRPPPDTPVPDSSPDVSRDVPEGIENPSLSSSSLSSSSPPSPLSQLSSSETTSQTAESAREKGSGTPAPTDAESGVHPVLGTHAPAPLSLSVSPPMSPNVPGRKTARSGVGHRLAPGWSPSLDTVRWTEAQGVDAAAILEEFRDHWLARTDARARKADWDATFRNRVRTLLAEGRAPMLPPAPAPPPPKGDPAQAASVADYLNGNRMPAILAAKEAKRG